MPNVLQTVTVPVGITFDPCQGLREAKQKIVALRAAHGDEVKVEVVFDARHLELISEYTTLDKKDEELFGPEQLYLTSQGGLLNLTVPMNLLRVAGTLSKWRKNEFQRTGICPISRFVYTRPDSGTPAGQLWDVLGMEGLTQIPPQNDTLCGVMEFQSRYVTPFRYVTEDDMSQPDLRKKNVLTYFTDWISEIVDRIGDRAHHQLAGMAIPEIINNVVYHGGGGLVGLSVWPSGQIEIVWSNPLDNADPPWPYSDKPQVLAESLITSKSGGVGIKFIREYLLKEYTGVLIVNWQNYHLVFRSGGDISIFGLRPRSKEFMPRSILFNLHLFSQEARDRSSRNDRR